MTLETLFCYGTLRGDYSKDGDRWGITKIKGVEWEYGKIKGFRLYQDKGLFYPFAIKTNNKKDIIYGCIIKCNSKELFDIVLKRCDRIEGYDGTMNGLYNRSLETTYSTMDKKYSSYIYYQKYIPKENIIYFRLGDWFINRKERNRIDKIYPNGCNCIVFSAPHNIKLIRNENKFHKNEIYTDDIAKIFSNLSNGGYISWSKEELRRCNKHGPDPKNKDPNYLKLCDIEESEWYKYFRKSLTNYKKPFSIHFDIHGMKGPKDKVSISNRADCILGMVPMEKNMGFGFTNKFKNLIEKNLIPILAKYNMEIMVGGKKTSNYPQLSGYWGNGRNTLTQISSNGKFFKKYSFSHSIQVELSLKLRKLIISNREFCFDFINGFLKSWEEHYKTTFS